MVLGLSDRESLRNYFKKRFNLDELKDLVFDLDEEPESIAEKKREFPRELIAYFERQGKLDQLISKALEQRPDDQIAKLLTKVPSSEIVTTAAEKPPLWVGVPPMPNHFVGRDEQIADLIQRLTSGESLALSAEGLAGVGKTTLAVALAHHRDVLAHFKDGVLWAGLGPQADVLSVLNTWAEALGIDVSGLTEEVARQQAVRDKIGQRRILLVIDDVWDIQAAERLRCGGPYCCHLLTTRDKGIARQFAGLQGMHSVQPLEDDPAFALLQQLAPEACAADPQAARALAQAVGGLPLALELLGSFLALPRRNLLPQLGKAALAKLMDPQRRLQLAKARLGAPGQEVTLADTIRLSLEGLRELEEGEAAERAFYSLGAFAPKPEQFSWEAAEAVAEVEARIVALLVERNLLESTGEQLSLHQTLTDVARMRMNEAAAVRHRHYYLNLVNEDWDDWRRIEQIYGQLKWAWHVAAKTNSEEIIHLVFATRRYQRRQGLWHDYIEWVERGLELVQYTGKRRDKGRLLNELGVIYKSLGNSEKALEYYIRALSIAEDVGYQGDLAIILNNLGSLYNNLGHWKKALEYFSQALLIVEELGDRDGLAITLNNLGRLYDSLGQREKALEYYNQALLVREEIGGRDGLATTLNDLGLLYASLGQIKDALEYYNRALSMAKELGDRDGVAATLNNLGLHYNSMGQYEKALECFSNALSIAEEVSNQRGLAIALNNLGGLYNSLGQRKDALEFYNRALPILEEVGNRSGLATTLNNLGGLYNSLGQREKALDFFNRALPIMEEVGDRRGVATMLNNLGGLYDSLGQRNKALEFYDRALPIMEEVGDKYGESVTRYNLATSLREEGRLAEAAAHLRRTVELDRLVQHPDLESDMALLAQVEAELEAQKAAD